MAESQNLEWKSSWRDEHLKWICGFANAQGGVLVIGKDDQGQIVGVKDPLRLLEEIPNKAQSLLGIVVDVSLRTERSGEYLEIKVAPYPNPISYRGEYHYRSGSTKQVLKGNALNQFLLSKHGRNWDDAPVPGVGMRELDRSALDEFRRRGVASHRLPSAALDESHGNLIELLHLREGEYLRRAAVLLFHPDPTRFFRGAFVKIGYFRTETDLAYQDVIEGSLFAQAERTVDLLLTKYSKHWISYHGILRRETPLAPGDALREAVLNAIAHRDYGNPAPIQIRVYDNRISLWNPGALPTGWTLDKLMGAHASAPRNPGIANAFFRAGMIEAWGRGVADILKSCRLAGTAQPRWEVDPDGLWLEFAGTRADDGSPALQAADKTDLDGSDISNEEIRGDHLRPESGAQPELRLGSLAERVLRQLAQGPLSKAGLSSKLGQKRVSGQLNKEIRVLVRDGRIGYTLPEKPRSRLQMYRLTDKGRAAVQRFLPGRAEEEIRGHRPWPESGAQPETQPESRPEMRLESQLE